MPPPKNDSDAKKDAILSSVVDHRRAFDDFTTELIGIRYNGESKVLDRSGGLLGRMETRVAKLERDVPALRAMVLATWKAIGATLILLMLGQAITNFDKIKWLIQVFK